MSLNRQQNEELLHWQSKLILLATLPLLAAYAVLATGQALWLGQHVAWQALAISAAFGILVFSLRAATAFAAFTGALITATLYYWTPGWHTALWPLLALFLLTFAATKFGRRHKEKMGTAEGKRGRTASQVAANLGVAALASIPMSSGHLFTNSVPGRVSLIAMLAALAEATADTLSSELGQVLGGEPRMLTTFRRVPPGTDGGISFPGTVAGCAGAAVVIGVAFVSLHLRLWEVSVAWIGGVVGLFADSLFGATLERRGWLNNDAVNFLSTLVAALVGAWLWGVWR